jgi:hypothetical protein
MEAAGILTHQSSIRSRVPGSHSQQGSQESGDESRRQNSVVGEIEDDDEDSAQSGPWSGDEGAESLQDDDESSNEDDIRDDAVACQLAGGASGGGRGWPEACGPASIGQPGLQTEFDGECDVQPAEEDEDLEALMEELADLDHQEEASTRGSSRGNASTETDAMADKEPQRCTVR